MNTRRLTKVALAVAISFGTIGVGGAAPAGACGPDPAGGACDTVLGAVNDASHTVDCIVGYLTLNPC